MGEFIKLKDAVILWDLGGNFDFVVTDRQGAARSDIHCSFGAVNKFWETLDDDARIVELLKKCGSIREMTGMSFAKQIGELVQIEGITDILQCI